MQTHISGMSEKNGKLAEKESGDGVTVLVISGRLMSRRREARCKFGRALQAGKGRNPLDCRLQTAS